MAIQVGEKIPSATLHRLTDGGVEQVQTDEFFKGRKVVVFALPGAFTPTCSKTHLPGYVAKADEIKGKGVDEIACLSVNDAFVMKAWGESLGADGKVAMLADGSGVLTRALGMDLDLTAKGLGVRSKRYPMVVEDGVVKSLEVDPNPGEVSVSGAERCLTAIG